MEERRQYIITTFYYWTKVSFGLFIILIWHFIAQNLFGSNTNYEKLIS